MKYHDYRAYLRDHFSAGRSLRELSRSAGLASGYLPMVLKGSHALSTKALKKLLPALNFTAAEAEHFVLLHRLSDGRTQADRMNALRALKRTMARFGHAKELLVAHYLTHWHHVAIREMAELPDFQPNPKWIRKRLKYQVSLKEIRDSLRFLTEHGFLESVQTQRGETKIRPRQNSLICDSGVYRVAMAEFHERMLGLAVDSIYDTLSKNRNVSSHTLAISIDQIAEVRAIQEDALKRIAALQEQGTPQVVIHTGFVAFPLTLHPALKAPKHAKKKTQKTQ